MGLAASQARLLTITARKSDCEYQSMALSHEKIALSRDMEHFSDEYQASLSKTRLVYDYFGSGTSEMAVNYGVFMNPSIYNDYSPKLLTNSKNRVILSSKFAAAAAAAGIPQEGYMGTPSSDIRNRFVQGLVDNNVITSITGTAIQSVSYNNEAGLGLDLESHQVTREITYDDVLKQLKSVGQSTSDYGLQFGGDVGAVRDAGQSYPDNFLLGKNADWTYLFTTREIGRDQEGPACSPHSMNLVDLLSSDNVYIYGLKALRGASKPINEMAYMQQLIAGVEGSPSFLNWMTDEFSKVLGGTTKNDLALNYAYNQVYDLIYPNEDLQNISYGICESQVEYEEDYYFGERDERERYAFGENNNEWSDIMRQNGTCVLWKWDRDVLTDGFSGAGNGVAPQAPGYIGMVFSECGDAGKKDQLHGVAIDLGNLAKVFLTAYVEFQKGIENSSYYYNIGSTNYVSLYNPSNDNFGFEVAEDIEYEDGTTNLTIQYYDQLLNIICSQGWTENAQIEDQAYMQQLLKNGSIFISTMGNDNRYSQNSYNTDPYITEVADTDAIAQAEAKYNTEKTKIESKENQIDLKLKNLDTEISALTTEYDTVKSLIQKTVEKSIKRYEA